VHPTHASGPGTERTQAHYASAMGKEGRRELPALGPRGEGWVLIQAVLLVLLVLSGLAGPRWPAQWGVGLRALGALLGAVGALLFLGGARSLGTQLTPYPKPVDDGDLREVGLYRMARHPIYGGVLLLAVGWSLATSALAFGPAGLLAVLFEAKSRREEVWLLQRHRGYEDYRRRVRRRFIPYVW
jgi:protein-S-isoprenylcysteine O-methyltransferase Ste14